MILLFVFGLSGAVTIPLLFAACTIMGTLGIVYGFAHQITMATYVTNLVQLIGLGIAIDYSLLIVYRFREEVERNGSKDDAIVRTMETAGRAVVFSGATVAIGLALLLFMPSPFMRSMGIGGFLIPLVSIAAAVTLQPALLSIYGRGGVRRIPVFGRTKKQAESRGYWERLASSIMQRPILFLVGGTTFMLLLAVPAFWLQLTPGSAEGIPRHPQAVHGFDILKGAVGAGALSPTQVIVDTGKPGGAADPAVQQSIQTFVTDVSKRPGGALRPLPAGAAVHRPERPVRADRDRGRARVRRRAGAEVRPHAARRRSSRRWAGPRTSACSPGAVRRRAWTSSTARTPSSRGSCSGCSG